jgi:hypothetical protein
VISRTMGMGSFRRLGVRSRAVADAVADDRYVVGTDETGRPRGILGDHELRTVVGNFPIGALTAFPGTGLDQGTVDQLLRRFRAQRP